MSVADHSTALPLSSATPRSAQEILPLLTVEEKASLLAGVDDWHFAPIPRLGIPSTRVTDCGHGVTLCGDLASQSTCFPTGIGMAATWDVELMERTGRILGQETRALGCSILLGPKINLHRHPLNGRSFETFSEDPWLAGLLGAAIIRGIQEMGVGACVKAMAGNNQQRDQAQVSSEIEERVLRELYLRCFELAVRHGKPCSIMTAYNRLNGVHCAESRWLITQVIKGDWAYPGFVLSDWRSIHTQEVYNSGMDLEMPGPGKFLNRKSVLNALEEGLLTPADLNDKVERILGAVLRYGQDETADTPYTVDSPEARALALEVAENSVTLLKNDGMLPLEKSTLKRILVTGPNAAEARIGGGGSASVTPVYSVSPLEGIREICGSEVEVVYLEGCSLVGTMEPPRDCFSHRGADGELVPGLLAEFHNSRNPGAAADAAWAVPHIDYSWGWASPGPGIRRGNYSVRFHGFLTPPVTGRYRFGVYAQEGCIRMSLAGESVVDSWDVDGENFEENYQNRYLTVEHDFRAGETVPIELTYGKRAARGAVRLEWEVPGAGDTRAKAAEIARGVDAVIICAGLSNLLEGGAADRVNMSLPEAQLELIRVVSAANPRTAVVLNSGGPLAVPWEAQVSAVLQAWYAGQEGGRAVARILFGETNPSGKLPDTIPHRLEDHAAIANYPGDGVRVNYAEGLFIGYRHFDHAGIEPHYPFGFGLSYTTFEVSAPVLDRESIATEGGVAQVLVKVRNTGERAGREVVQLYLRAENSAVERPEKELRGFRKVTLAAGEEKEVTFTIGQEELEYFNVEAQSWQVEPGSYLVLVGSHSRSVQGVPLLVE